MITPGQFLEIIGTSVATKGEERNFALATISPTYTSGAPAVVFDGEEVVTTKTYTRLASYTPVAGDRVLLAQVGHTWVILGKVV